jgi:hypothetical protein
MSVGRGEVTESGRLPSTLVAGLGRLARSSPVEEAEKCEICGSGLATEHRHLLELGERRILCSCEPCIAMRSGMDNYCPVGTRFLWLEDFELPGELWASFQLPIGLAFFFYSTGVDAVVALYPSPAGATESELHLESWEKLQALNPILENLEADAEALVINRMDDEPQYAVVPIDECYRLVGLIKSTWEGISGGSAIENAVPKFFEYVRHKARVDD